MYQKPSGFMSRVMNRGIRFAVERLGRSPGGAQSLTVRGRKSGQPHTIPVNPLTVDGQRYLVAPRGNTQWVRNLRAAGEGELHLGKKVEHFTASEVPDDEKVPFLRAYLQRWAWQTTSQFGLGKDASDADLARIAPDHPIFRITPR
jgi:deazaflavin-dependent oxidoreductase (nitroreductase family)